MRQSVLKRVARATMWLVLILGALVTVAYGVAALSTSSSGLARAVVWRAADVDDQSRFPARPVRAGLPTWRFARSKGAAVPKRVRWEAEGRSDTRELDAALAESGTTAFLVVRDGALIYERYFNGASTTSLATSFSVAKSVLSTLVGIAISEGRIASIDQPITDYVPELTASDKRFAKVTLRHLLGMNSGLRYEERGLPWSDDAQTYYATDLRELALERSEVEEPPGRFHYNNFNPLLVGLALERAVGMRVSDYLGRRLWRPAGMEFDASWSLDSVESGFEKMESGLNAAPRDYARLGRLFLENGRVDGRQVVPVVWVAEATSRSDGSGGGYGLYWWLDGAADDPSAFYARGNHGQFVYVSPATRTVIVRLGRKLGYDRWLELFRDIAAARTS